jgi:hypothetical protein
MRKTIFGCSTIIFDLRRTLKSYVEHNDKHRIDLFNVKLRSTYVEHAFDVCVLRRTAKYNVEHKTFKIIIKKFLQIIYVEQKNYVDQSSFNIYLMAGIFFF